MGAKCQQVINNLRGRKWKKMVQAHIGVDNNRQRGGNQIQNVVNNNIQHEGDELGLKQPIASSGDRSPMLGNVSLCTTSNGPTVTNLRREQVTCEEDVKLMRCDMKHGNASRKSRLEKPQHKTIRPEPLHRGSVPRIENTNYHDDHNNTTDRRDHDDRCSRCSQGSGEEVDRSDVLQGVHGSGNQSPPIGPGSYGSAVWRLLAYMSASAMVRVRSGCE